MTRLEEGDLRILEMRFISLSDRAKLQQGTTAHYEDRKEKKSLKLTNLTHPHRPSMYTSMCKAHGGAHHHARTRMVVYISKTLRLISETEWEQ
jgi:hypothetical protein